MSGCCQACGSLRGITDGLCLICRYTYGTVERMNEIRRLGWDRRDEWPPKEEAQHGEVAR